VIDAEHDEDADGDRRDYVRGRGQEEGARRRRVGRGAHAAGRENHRNERDEEGAKEHDAQLLGYRQ
jgi:hypothetical protein